MYILTHSCTAALNGRSLYRRLVNKIKSAQIIWSWQTGWLPFNLVIMHENSINITNILRSTVCKLCQQQWTKLNSLRAEIWGLTADTVMSCELVCEQWAIVWTPDIYARDSTRRGALQIQPQETGVKVREAIRYSESVRFDLHLCQFVAITILLKCHLGNTFRTFVLKKRLKFGCKYEDEMVESYRYPRRRSGRDQKLRFLHFATRSRCSVHQYQLQKKINFSLLQWLHSYTQKHNAERPCHLESNKGTQAKSRNDKRQRTLF